MTETGLRDIRIYRDDDGAGSVVFRVLVDPYKDIPELPKEIEGIPVDIKRRAPVRLLDSAPNCNGGDGPPCHSQALPLPVEMAVVAVVEAGNVRSTSPL